MSVADDVDASDSTDSDGYVDMERDSDNEEEEDEEEDYEQQEDEEEENEDEDDGKEPQPIGQGEVVNTLTDDVDTIVDNQPIALPEQGQEMRKHTRLPSAPDPALWPQTPEPHPLPPIPETHPLCGLGQLGLLTPQKLHPAVRALRESEAARNTSGVDVE